MTNFVFMDDEKNDKVLRKVMKQMAEDLKSRVRKNIDKDPIYGWTHNVDGTFSDSIETYVDRDLNAYVGTRLIYPLKLEYGVPKGYKLDYDGLVEWAKLKFNDDDKTANLRAKMVYEDVINRGIPAYRMFYWGIVEFTKGMKGVEKW